MGAGEARWVVEGFREGAAFYYGAGEGVADYVLVLEEEDGSVGGEAEVCVGFAGDWLVQGGGVLKKA